MTDPREPERGVGSPAKKARRGSAALDVARGVLSGSKVGRSPRSLSTNEWDGDADANVWHETGPLAEIDERLDEIAPAPTLGHFLQEQLERLLGFNCVAIGPPGSERVVHVDDAHDLREHRYGVATQAVGIAGTVEVLVMVTNDRAHATQ